MLDQSEIQKIKETIKEFFRLTTIIPSDVEVSLNGETHEEVEKDVIDAKVKLQEPQVLIGEKGQTLFEIQRILKMILNRKLKKNFYLNLDINEYKQKKSEYLKGIAKELANEVTITKQEKVLVPMSAYERRIIHSELAKNHDVLTESCGEGLNRHIVIKVKPQ